MNFNTKLKSKKVNIYLSFLFKMDTFNLPRIIFKYNPFGFGKTCSISFNWAFLLDRASLSFFASSGLHFFLILQKMRKSIREVIVGRIMYYLFELNITFSTILILCPDDNDDDSVVWHIFLAVHRPLRVWSHILYLWSAKNESKSENVNE